MITGGRASAKAGRLETHDSDLGRGVTVYRFRAIILRFVFVLEKLWLRQRIEAHQVETRRVREWM